MDINITLREGRKEGKKERKNGWKKGKHSTNFQTSTSGGTGYCDCGDVEAWKEQPWCSKHKPPSTDSEQLIKDLMEVDVSMGEDDAISEFNRRARIILHSVLDYAIQLLCWDYSDILPEHLEAR